MLDIILQILSVLGIILLIVLLVAVVLLLLVLFFPITYRLYGSKKQKEIYFSAKVKWLFGILRVNYIYPEPGKIVARLLWFKVFDSSEKATAPAKVKDKVSRSEGKGADKEKKDSKDNKDKTSGETHVTLENKAEAEINETSVNIPSENCGTESITAAEKNDKTAGETQGQGDTLAEDSKPPTEGILEKFREKLEKIKYTIRNICDKIKMIWKNISYYRDLLQEENTRELFSHVCLRIGKMLKSIRPRHLKARVLAGTGSPDTTGYLYGVYGMLLPVLGIEFLVTPDFERAVLEGEIKASGHITVAVLLVNGLKLLLDKKLHLFIKKLRSAPGIKSEDGKIVSSK